MATMTKLGPAEHGEPLTLEEFETSDYERGYKYELIDGRLYVSPMPNVPENWVEQWIFGKLPFYSERHPAVTNYVTTKARVFVPGRRRTTCPEPDVTAFQDFPLEKPIRSIRWQDLRPMLAVEVLTGDDPDKDLVRNVDLYLQVPSIKEYWVIDAREDPEQPSLRVHRRHGSRWRIVDVAFGETYETRFLPGFSLLVDPRG